MADASTSKPDPFRASLIGGICASAAVLAFLGLHWALHAVGQLTAEVTFLVPTKKLMRPLAGAAIPLGLAIGFAAGKLRRFRKGVLVASGMAAYVLTSAIATVWLRPQALGQHSLSYWIGQGLWAALTYALVAGAPLVAAFVVMERLTRPAPPSDEHADEEGPTADDEADDPEARADDHDEGEPTDATEGHDEGEPTDATEDEPSTPTDDAERLPVAADRAQDDPTAEDEGDDQEVRADDHDEGERTDATDDHDEQGEPPADEADQGDGRSVTDAERAGTEAEAGAGDSPEEAAGDEEGAVDEDATDAERSG